MVFTNENWNDTNEIIVYSNYHKYWLDKDRKIVNPLFDVFSGKILDLKEGKPEAVRYFYNLLDDEICKAVTICVVPSSNADNHDSGIAQLGHLLAQNGRTDMVDYLQRKESIKKLAWGGDRSKETHFRTIIPSSDKEISGDVVLLIDDVTTTGNSLYACKEILLRSGAEKVEMFALGKAI